jgi:hypothetical protein
LSTRLALALEPVRRQRVERLPCVVLALSAHLAAHQHVDEALDELAYQVHRLDGHLPQLHATLQSASPVRCDRRGRRAERSEATLRLAREAEDASIE